MRFLSCLILILAIPNAAMAWWSDKWSYRMPITINAVAPAANVSTGGMDNVVLIKMHAGNFPDFLLLQENLADLRFIAADDKTPLKFHVDSFDLANQFLFVWVNIPDLAEGKPEKIFLYYGNSQAVTAIEAGTTFDANQAAVFHIKATEPMFEDATAYNTKASMTGLEVGASLIGSGLKFNGDSEFLVQDSPGLQFDSVKGITFSAWVKPTVMDTTPRSLLSRTDANGNSLNLIADAKGISVQLVNAGKLQTIQSSKSIEAGKWNHLAVVMDKTQLHLYLNAEEVKTEPVANLTLSGAISIGAKSSLASGFVGEMDEIHFANVALSQKAFAIATKNQGITDELVSLQAAEQLGAGNSDSGFLTVILKNTDELGWGVMIIMLIMSAISWIVMIGKALYLRKVRADNKAFLQEYAKVVDSDITALDADDEDDGFADAPMAQALFGKHDHFQSSTLYHLYHRGIKEVQVRAKRIQAFGLTARAADSLRATLDSQMIREAQRLNSQMILLTIAISGGPFLGLFGTVMGVMITFAAIAKTGDVNIAAIAPGVAAALLTTVTGLFVAIPALFGYNYLGSRIKESIADMRIFCDEYATRLAESYGRS